jgi:hypothetical protein
MSQSPFSWTKPTAIVVHVEQVYPHCPKSLMRANAWQPEQWVPADAQPTSAEVTLAQLNLPGLTVDQIRGGRTGVAAPALRMNSD